MHTENIDTNTETEKSNLKEYKYYLVYKTTNNINGKIYIGRHATNRINDTYKGSGTALKHAFKKYGKENFTREILFECENHLDMITKEAETIEKYKNDGAAMYNISPGEPYNDGKVFVTFGSDEYKKRQSEASKRMWQDENYIKSRKLLLSDENYHKKMSESAKRRFENEEERKRDSDMVRGLWKDDAFREKLLESRRNANMREETKKNRSESSKKSFAEHPERRRRLSEANKERFSTKESRLKQSKRIKKAWEDPEKLEKLINAFRGRIWIKNDSLHLQKQILAEDFEKYSNEGWVRGGYGNKQTRKFSHAPIAILQCDLDGNVIKEWKSRHSAEKALNLCRAFLNRCLNGTMDSYLGFAWKYKEPRANQ